MTMTLDLTQAPRRSTIHIAADDAVFDGHFPGHPIVPGALLLDEVLQAASQAHPGCRWRLQSGKFVSPAVPGEALSVELFPPSTSATLNFRVLAGEQVERVIASGSLQIMGHPA